MTVPFVGRNSNIKLSGIIGRRSTRGSPGLCRRRETTLVTNVEEYYAAVIPSTTTGDIIVGTPAGRLQ